MNNQKFSSKDDQVLNPWDKMSCDMADSIISACEDDNKIELLAEKIVDDLPHGSGIDCMWNFSITDNVINFNNSYHVRSEFGYYVYYVDFNFDIRVVDPIEEILDLLDFYYSQEIDLSDSCGLSEYIKDAVYLSLCEKYNII
jgi:hypothetical protein